MNDTVYVCVHVCLGLQMCPGKALALLEIEHMTTMLACDCEWEVVHEDEGVNLKVCALSSIVCVHIHVYRPF